MSAEEQLQQMVDQTIEMAIMNIDAYMKEIEAFYDTKIEEMPNNIGDYLNN